MIRGAIAIGSNSTRLLVAEKKNGQFYPIERGREETRLFLGLDAQGAIRPERLEETARAVERLYQMARARGAQSVALFATSATRDAKNGQALAGRIQALTGLSLRVISGEEEARLAFAAVAGGARRLVMDIGGGSTELTLGDGGKIEYAKSAQMGASRLLRQCPIASPEDAERALSLACQALTPYAEALSCLPPAPQMIGLGGTCTTAAAIWMGREAHGEAVEGQIITKKEAERQLQLLSGLSLEERARVPGLPPARAAHMPHGLCILIAALSLCQMEGITVSGRTNLDGYLMALPE